MTVVPDASAYADVDKVIHEPARLALMTNLSIVDEADFVFLLDRTGLSAGNAGSHLAKLEDAGYVTSSKDMSGRRPRTTYALTGDGRRALRRYRATVLPLVEVLPA